LAILQRLNFHSRMIVSFKGAAMEDAEVAIAQCRGTTGFTVGLQLAAPGRLVCQLQQTEPDPALIKLLELLFEVHPVLYQVNTFAQLFRCKSLQSFESGWNELYSWIWLPGINFLVQFLQHRSQFIPCQLRYALPTRQRRDRSHLIFSFSSPMREPCCRLWQFVK